MPDFPEITPSEPVVKPAESEKVFSKLWMQKLEVHAEHPMKPTQIYIELVPLNDSGEILKEPVKKQIIPDAFALAGQDPEFAQALGAVIAMANKYKDHNFQPQSEEPI